LISPALETLLASDKTGERDLCLTLWEEYQRREVVVLDALSRMSKDLEDLRNTVRSLVTEWTKKTGIGFPSDLIRFVLQLYLRMKNPAIAKKLNEDAFLRNTLAYVYNTETPFCWDGCLRCIRLKNAYLLQPIDQVFHLSKKLTIYLLKILKAAITDKSDGTSLKMGKGVGLELLNLLKNAKKDLRIISPWISPEIAETIIKIAQVNNVKVKVITRPPASSEPQQHILAVKMLSSASQKLRNIKLAYNDKVHAKIVIVDSELVISGSMNLTKHGIEINIESIATAKANHLAYKIIAEFESLWQSSKRIE